YYVLELPALTGRLDYELRVASPPEGASRLLTKISAARVPSWQLFHPVISPDGLLLALPLTDGAPTNIRAISTKAGSFRAPTTFRISATSATVAPPGPKPVEVFTKSAHASRARTQAFTFSSSVSSAASMMTLTMAPAARLASTTAATSRATSR